MGRERVLVVHTDPAKRRALVQALRAAGYDVRSAAAPAALSRLRLERFELLAGQADVTLEQVRSQALLPLRQITERLVSETSLASIASAILDRVRLDGGAAAAWLIIEDDPSLPEVAGETALEPAQLAELGRLLLKRHGPAAEPLYLRAADLASGPGARGTPAPGEACLLWTRQEGWDGLLMVPMAVKRQRIGAVFAAGRSGTLRTSPVDLRYLSILAAQAAIAIENTRHYDRARTQSLTDPLTGLPNSRFLRDQLGFMLAQALHGRRPLSVILLDSDSLKKVNDRFGHQAGDRLVIELAQTIKGRGHGVRASDIAVRYAGDEFVILMPDTDAQQALVVAERLRAAMSDRPFRVGDEAVPCTISLGVATYPTDAGTPDELLRCADDAMYEAKRRGKNRVVAYGAIAAGPAPAVAVAAGAG